MKNGVIKKFLAIWIVALLSTFLFNTCIDDYFNKDNVIEDIDGNTYNIVTIGTQVWMAENLRTTKFNDSTSINRVKDTLTWKTTTSHAYSYYINNGTIYGKNYGAFYNWFAVESGKLCPAGWHVPSNEEWQTLLDYTDANVNGGKLKEVGFDHWKEPNEGASDNYGFAARGSGYRNANGEFGLLYENVYLWTSTEFNSYEAWAYGLDYDSSEIAHLNMNKASGLCIRCIKD